MTAFNYQLEFLSTGSPFQVAGSKKRERFLQKGCLILQWRPCQVTKEVRTKMRKLVFRIGTAMFTFFVGIGLATALVFRSDSPTISPIDISAQPRTAGQLLEMVFVLDTTSSMTGLIDGAKQRIWGIVNEVMQSPSHPSVKIGLVGYRDRGDAYVTTVLPLTSDLDKVYSTLMNYQAAGGGDAPEDVRRALADGVRSVGWSKVSSGLAQILFLVGDAPPHDDYQDEPDTAVTTAEAVQKGIIVNTIQCGDMPGTREVWQAISRIGLGQYFSIAQDGGVQTIATPYDEQLGTLATKLGSTYVAYGFGGGAEGEKRGLKHQKTRVVSRRVSRLLLRRLLRRNVHSIKP